ncbi:hypothetical protein B0T19DRAFT_244495 [Cercophora scortea]|uniref:Uncharacterized protein n=1 Tax=Cercophora scortea TaxID=314031 RepID=A0AAE0I9N7_9PEZI|nr:hypothetical protein B0T19DRAFT_244495 [Cercophora scortea]
MPPPNTPGEGVPAAGSSPPESTEQYQVQVEAGQEQEDGRSRVAPPAAASPIPSIPPTPAASPPQAELPPRVSPPPTPELQFASITTSLESTSPPRPSLSTDQSTRPNRPLFYDHQALEYEGPYDETLQCPICRTPFYLPLTTRTCGHTFCAGCLRRALELRPVCPIDRQPIDKDHDIYQTRVINDQLDRLRVKCPNKGCDHVCTRDRLPAHYSRQCPFSMVPCPDRECSHRIIRMNADPDKACLHRETSCQYCSATVMIADLDSHYDNHCAGHTTKCTQCDSVVVRHRMEGHIAAECPETEVHCRWHPYGCNVFGRRATMQGHQRAGCVYEAIAKLTQARLDDRAVIDELKGRVSTLSSRLNQQEQELRGRSRPSMGHSTGVPVSDFDVHTSTRAASMPYNSAAWGSAEDYMLAQFERIETNAENLRKMVLEINGHHNLRQLNDTMRLDGLISELQSKIGVLGMHTTWLMNVQRQSRGQQRAGGVAGGPPAPEMSTGNSGNAGARMSTEGERLPYMGIPPRRHSNERGEGRGENPPRL